MTNIDPRIARARALRVTQTDAERRLWRVLRGARFAGKPFRRQHPIGPYFVDFVCLDARLVIEVDGSQHIDQQRYDEARTAWLSAEGYRVVRFSDREVLTAIGSVSDAIWAELSGG